MYIYIYIYITPEAPESSAKTPGGLPWGPGGSLASARYHILNTKNANNNINNNNNHTTNSNNNTITIHGIHNALYYYMLCSLFYVMFFIHVYVLYYMVCFYCTRSARYP